MLEHVNSTDRLLFNMLSAIAQFERELMLDGNAKGFPRLRLTENGFSYQTTAGHVAS